MEEVVELWRERIFWFRFSDVGFLFLELGVSKCVLFLVEYGGVVRVVLGN